MKSAFAKFIYSCLYRLDKFITSKDCKGWRVSLAIAALIYFAPTLQALRHHRPNLFNIFMINLLLGLTVIGWIIMLYLYRKPVACKIPEKRLVHESA